jgi:pyruvate dehydrogenase E1 component alpha subunit
MTHEDAVHRLHLASEALCAAVGHAPDHALPIGGLAPIVAGALAATPKGDWVVAGPRERAGLVLRGATPERLAQAYGLRPYKLAPSKGAPGTRALHAVGLAMSSGRPVLCFLGNASAASGAFHEALNTAALTGAPVVFVLTLHELTDDAPVGRQLAADPVALAAAHGLHAAAAAPTLDAVQAAVTTARDAGGPALVAVRLNRS